jgi:hypothetical protein
VFRRARIRGFPPGGIGASSFHLTWRLPPAAGHLVEASARLEVLAAPVVEHLYFWALQVSFPGAGAAHLGLQWNRTFPSFGAANWGGYASGGGLLPGTASSLTSSPNDPNTRDFPWQPARPYRLRVARVEPGVWRGEITDTTTGTASVVRNLHAPSEFLGEPMVWSEVFARCDDPSVTVRWSDFEIVSERGARFVPDGLLVNYQSHADGGCANTTSVVDPDGHGVLQITNTERVTPQGAELPSSG